MCTYNHPMTAGQIFDDFSAYDTNGRNYFVNFTIVINLLETDSEYKEIYFTKPKKDRAQSLWIISKNYDYDIQKFLLSTRNPYSIKKNLDLLLSGYINYDHKFFPIDIATCCAEFCYGTIDNLEKREKELNVRKRDEFYFIDHDESNAKWMRGLNEIQKKQTKRIWNVQILRADNENGMDLSIGIANQYGTPKNTYFMNIVKDRILTKGGIINVKTGDIISVVYIRQMVNMPVEPKRIIFFINDRPCDIVVEIRAEDIVWDHDYKITAQVFGDCDLKIL